MQNNPAFMPSLSSNRAVAETSEEALLAALRAGEDVAFTAFAHQHAGPMLAVARRIVGNEEDARDALQEAFLSAFKAIKTFEGGSRLSTWLHRIVVNAALMKLRSRKRAQERSIEDLLPKFLSDGHPVTPAAAWRETGDSEAQKKENRMLVRAAIEELPEIYRTVLLLRDIEEMSTEETAEVLGINNNAVKTRLHRARQALRTLLDPRFREGP